MRRGPGAGVLLEVLMYIDGIEKREAISSYSMGNTPSLNSDAGSALHLGGSYISDCTHLVLAEV